MIRTPMTEALGISVPIIQAGMSWASSNSALPAAVSAAGGLGVVAAGPMRPDDLRRAIGEVRAETTAPFAVNIPLYGKYRDEHLAIVRELAVPVLIASQGGPNRYEDIIHDTATRCLHVVSSTSQAVKAAAAGVDGLIVVGGEAGGHPPSHAVSTMVSTRAILREDPGLPVATSGGVADGHGVAAMLMLGADAVQMGTRFAATTESRLHPAYKQRLVEAGIDQTDTVGLPGKAIRVIPNGFTEKYEQLRREGAEDQAERLFASTSLRQSAADGDVDTGKVEAGQTVGLVDDIVPVKVLMERIRTEYQNAIRRMDLMHSGLDPQVVSDAGTDHAPRGPLEPHLNESESSR